jgi:hypothetical protein
VPNAYISQIICECIFQSLVLTSNELDAKLSEKKLVKLEDYRAAVTFSRILASIFGLILVYAIVSLPSLMHNNDNSKPFTMEDWGYAVKDGYLPLMVMHYIRNGGL